MDRAAVHAAVDALLDALLADGGAARTYDAEHLPPGITRDAFLRRARIRLREGVDGWTRVGQRRLVTAQAWEREVDSETARARRRSATVQPTAANDVEDEIDAALGIRIRRVSP